MAARRPPRRASPSSGRTRADGATPRRAETALHRQAAKRRARARRRSVPRESRTGTQRGPDGGRGGLEREVHGGAYLEVVESSEAKAASQLRRQHSRRSRVFPPGLLSSRPVARRNSLSLSHVHGTGRARSEKPGEACGGGVVSAAALGGGAREGREGGRPGAELLRRQSGPVSAFA
ncbi:hypothetical protein BS78_09G153700 [Paspalum vaginatum]|uniref:Uncharacterized protein n=1 Tax=Paspalum vaginatum TaxID=158149 RepID=A0A9W7X9J4_9POAL|nr:hypothetical protein BS78_K319700 [Paspalum vaginatum]KAJ1263035.1 hypothetical protein BS78_09G153700 [Paspalum vaginatum]